MRQPWTTMAARFCSLARPSRGLPDPKGRREHKGVTGSMARAVRWGKRGLQGLRVQQVRRVQRAIKVHRAFKALRGLPGQLALLGRGGSQATLDL